MENIEEISEKRRGEGWLGSSERCCSWMLSFRNTGRLCLVRDVPSGGGHRSWCPQPHDRGVPSHALAAGAWLRWRRLPPASSCFSPADVVPPSGAGRGHRSPFRWIFCGYLPQHMAPAAPRLLLRAETWLVLRETRAVQTPGNIRGYVRKKHFTKQMSSYRSQTKCCLQGAGSDAPWRCWKFQCLPRTVWPKTDPNPCTPALCSHRPRARHASRYRHLP